MLMLEDKIKKYKSIKKFNIDSMLMLKNKIKNKREREREVRLCVRAWVAQHALALKKAQACGLKAGPHAWAIIFFSFLSAVHSF
jgi:hypothetical protein